MDNKNNYINFHNNLYNPDEYSCCGFSFVQNGY